MESLQVSVSHCDSVFDTFHPLLLKVFSVGYLISHSITGPRPTPKMEPKTKFDERLYSTVLSIVTWMILLGVTRIIR